MRHILFLLISFCLFGCLNPPEFPIEPVITFTGLSKSSMIQGSIGPGQDSLMVFFSFTDGDGDLGIAQADRTGAMADLVVIDTRTGNIVDPFFMPYIPPKGAGNGIQGTGHFLFFTTCCTPGCPSEPGETADLILEFYARDRAGNVSESAFTTPITLICD